MKLLRSLLAAALLFGAPAYADQPSIVIPDVSSTLRAAGKEPTFNNIAQFYLNPALRGIASNFAGASCASTQSPVPYQWCVNTGASPRTVNMYVDGGWIPAFNIVGSTLVPSSGGGGGSGNVSSSGTPTSGQVAIWTSASQIQGVTPTGSGSPVLGTGPTITLTNGTGLPLSTGVTGNLTVGHLNSGTGASSSTFWRGDGTWAAPAGSGTVTSVGQTFTGGLISVAGSPVTGSGTLALTIAGTSGGIPYFSSASGWASSGALTANMPVIGGGAGVAPSSGTVSGNTTTFVTTTGTQTSGHCVSIDPSGNHVDNGAACGGSGSTGANPTASVGLTAVNGAATTFLRSDGAPALSQSIVPTWTGIHTFSAAPVFSVGDKYSGSTSGNVTVTAQATAGTPTITWPNTSGTVAVGASSPLALSTTTGNLTCATCVTSSGGGAITGTAPVAVSAAGAVSITGAAGQVLAGASPAFTNAPTLGVAGSTVGSLAFANATSGSVTLQPVTGALGSAVLSMPAATGTLAYSAGTGHGDSIYTVLATDRFVYTNAAFTASRTWTLPAANTVSAGTPITVADLQGTVTATNTLIIARGSTDTINGATSVTIDAAFGRMVLVSDGTSKWYAAYDRPWGTGALNAVNLDSSSKLPAVDGSALTNLNGSNIASGTVPTARLGSGSATSSTCLLGNSTWGACATGGTVKQIISGTSGNTNGTLTANATAFWSPSSPSSISTTESLNAEMLIPIAGTLKNLSVASSTTVAAGTWTMTLRTNTGGSFADTTLTCQLNSTTNTTTCTDTTHSTTVNAGDKIDVKFVGNAIATTINSFALGLEFDPS